MWPSMTAFPTSPSKCWDYNYKPSHLVFSLFFSRFELMMISPVPLTEGVIHYRFSLFYTLVKTQLNSCIWIYSWVLFSVLLRVFLFLYQYHTDTFSQLLCLQFSIFQPHSINSLVKKITYSFHHGYLFFYSLILYFPYYFESNW